MDTSSKIDGAVAKLLLQLDHQAFAKVITDLSTTLSSTATTEQDLTTASILAKVLNAVTASADANNHSFVVEKAYTVLLTFIVGRLNAIEANDLFKIRDVVDVAVEIPFLSKQLLEVCIQALRTQVYLLKNSSGESVTSLVTEEDPSSEYGSAVGDATEEYGSSRIGPLPILHCLTILKVLAWCQHIRSNKSKQECFLLLLMLLGAMSEVVAAACHDTLLALISTSVPATGVLSADVLSIPIDDNFVWNRLQELCSSSAASHNKTLGLSIWASLISSSTGSLLNLQVLQEENYWTTLHLGLARGTAQHRKTCLYILKSSLGLLNESISCRSFTADSSTFSAARRDFARYSTLFETIILARYLNQVQDCLPDLTNIVQRSSHVHAVWVASLLFAALELGMQDSIRQLLGDWTMSQYGVRVLQDTLDSVANFLHERFLPWATLGNHFTSTLRPRATGGLRCQHGEQLVTFLRQIITSRMSHKQRQEIVKSTLSFTKMRGAQMFSSARVYLLQGVVDGVREVNYQLDESDVEEITQLASFSGFHEMARDLMVLQCESLIHRSEDLTSKTSTVQSLIKTASLLKQDAQATDSICDARQSLEARLSPNRVQHSSPVSTQPPEEISVIDSLLLFNSWVRTSRSKCIAGHGLRAGLSYIQNILDDQSQNFDVVELDFALRALWEAIEVQGYPKNALITAPRVFFHFRCIKLVTPGDALQLILSQVALELQTQCQQKTYACWTFYASLRSAVLYVDEAKHLPLIELVSSFTATPPISKVEFDLEAAIAPFLTAYVPFRTYSNYYGESLGCGFAAFFDLINKLPTTGGDLHTRWQMLDKLLQPWLDQKPPTPVFSKWKSTTQLQTMLMLLEGVLPHLSVSGTEHYLESYNYVLGIEQLPRYRFLLEWIVARMYVLRVERRHDVVKNLASLDLTNPKLAVSLVKIALMLVKLPDSDEPFALKVMIEMNTLATSAKVAIRHEAQWTIPLLWTYCEAKHWSSIVDNAALACLNNSIVNSEIYKSPPAGRILESFDPITDHTLSFLFEGYYLDIEPREPPVATREDFLKVWRDDHHGVVTPNEFHLDKGLLPLGLARSYQRSRDVSYVGLGLPKEVTHTNSFVIPLQTKATTWQDLTATDSGIALSAGKRKTRDIIIIGSLIDNAYNIGGLSRIGEIFGVQSLQIANSRVIESKDFTSVAVSSHLWLPLEELKAEDLKQYLVEKKLEGYTVVGIEQTDRSKILGREDCPLPKKVVLVIGSEREGIPAQFLADMDLCVEVKQVGYTRSMNVQTAAAVVLYEYSRQYP